MPINATTNGGTKESSVLIPNKSTRKHTTLPKNAQQQASPHTDQAILGRQTRSGNSLNHIQPPKTAKKRKETLPCGCVDLLHCSHRASKNKSSNVSRSKAQDVSQFPTKMKPLKSCLAERRIETKPIWDYTSHHVTGVLFLFLVGLIFGVTALSWRWFHSWPHIPIDLKDLDSSPESLEKAIKWMQLQLQLVDIKLGTEVTNLKNVLDEKIAKESLNLEGQLYDVMTRLDQIGYSLDKFLPDGGSMTKKEIYDLIKATANQQVGQSSGSSLKSDDLRVIARKIIKSELEKHSADGLARADFAVESGGGHVVDHSEGYFLRRGQWILSFHNIFPGSTNLHPYAPKILQPSLGEPGQCLPLKGSDVFVDIALRTAILVEAVTLEHVARSIAFDLSSAPKKFQILGWHEIERDSSKTKSNKHAHRLLGEFTYNLEGPALQTFDLSLEESAKGFINIVRLHVVSNYGSPTHTCIYRFRVHGTDPWMPSAPVIQI